MKRSDQVGHLGTRVPLGLLLTWLPVVVWAGLIFALSATPNLRVAQSDLVDFVVRKAGHMAAFGILALLALVAWLHIRARLAEANPSA